MANEHLKNSQRQCGDCTACCEGHLSGEAYGIPFFPGRKCHFLGERGCTIYKHRPHDPCVTFKCAWIDDDRSLFPEWIRPDKSGVITRFVNWGNDQEYIRVFETGTPIRSEILNWFFVLHVKSSIPLSIQVNGGWNYYGPPEFVEEMMGIKSSKIEKEDSLIDQTNSFSPTNSVSTVVIYETPKV